LTGNNFQRKDAKARSKEMNKAILDLDAEAMAAREALAPNGHVRVRFVLLRVFALSGG
jgi:hypothetical protein